MHSSKLKGVSQRQDQGAVPKKRRGQELHSWEESSVRHAVKPGINFRDCPVNPEIVLDDQHGVGAGQHPEQVVKKVS